MMETKKKKITSGTKEWASSNVNIFSGCKNDCRYCYAKKMAIRFERKTAENWKKMELNAKAFNKAYKKRKGRIMFPTSHDITAKTYDPCIITLRKMLSVDNEVLITTKPEPICIINIINRLEEFKDQVQFRFTITSHDDIKLKFWEPNAPNFNDRVSCLKMAFERGWKTSVSIEPFLDGNPILLIKEISPFITESMWIGRMNYIRKNDILPEEKKFYDYQRVISSWSNIQKIFENVKELPDEIRSKIRLKDSIRNMYEKRGLEVTL